MKFASQKRIMAEIAVIRLCRPAMERNMDTVFDRIAEVERKLEEGVVVQAAVPVQTADRAERKPAAKPVLDRAIPDDIRQVVADWKGIIRDLSGMTKNYLRHARLSLGGENRLQIVFEDETAYSFVNRDVQKQELIEAIESRIGKQVELDIKLVDQGRSFEDSFVDIEKIVNMDITIED